MPVREGGDGVPTERGRGGGGSGVGVKASSRLRQAIGVRECAKALATCRSVTTDDFRLGAGEGGWDTNEPTERNVLETVPRVPSSEASTAVAADNVSVSKTADALIATPTRMYVSLVFVNVRLCLSSRSTNKKKTKTPQGFSSRPSRQRGDLWSEQNSSPTPQMPVLHSGHASSSNSRFQHRRVVCTSMRASRRYTYSNGIYAPHQGWRRSSREAASLPTRRAAR